LSFGLIVLLANFQSYSVQTVFKGAEIVTQQISTAALFVIAFMYTWEERISLTNLLLMELGLLALGFVARFFTDYSFHGKSIAISVKILLLLLGSLYMLSPVLMTLTKQFSGDTITACTIFLLICHLIFHDYAYVNGDSKRYGKKKKKKMFFKVFVLVNRFSAPVSLNAAIFASIMLGSRLQTSFHVFTLLIFAIELFALFPILRHHLKVISVCFHYCFGFLLLVFFFLNIYIEENK
jgi:phosphatidylinositol glycan class C protein